jgi:oxygen-independent coproporphyrinogen-3 oxidase
MRRQIIDRLMCQLDVELGGVAAGFGVVEPFAVELARLQPMASDGLVEIAGRRVRITERGRPFMRTVAAVFDRYLESGKARHSRAV